MTAPSKSGPRHDKKGMYCLAPTGGQWKSRGRGKHERKRKAHEQCQGALGVKGTAVNPAVHSSTLISAQLWPWQEAVAAITQVKLKEKPQLNEMYWWQGERWRGEETGMKTLPQHLTYSLDNMLWLWLVAPLFECITQPQNTKTQASINKACVFQAVLVCTDPDLSARSAWLAVVAKFSSNKLETPLAIHF